MNFSNSMIDFNDLNIKELNCKFDSIKIKKDSINIDINHLSFNDKSVLIRCDVSLEIIFETSSATALLITLE